ncbi:MAG: nucleotide exchange factor GrpE [Methanomassiliicoccaceae archaeon]|nr:nucleotide exchange factor GrpE [Methanomassiliicoccaceae archaeon]
MTQKKASKKTDKLRNFLVTGSVDDLKNDTEYQNEEQQEMDVPSAAPPQEAEVFEEELVIEDIMADLPSSVPEYEPMAPPEPAPMAADTNQLMKEIADLKATVASLSAELSKYATTKEQLREFSLAINKRDGELANKKFTGMLEQMSAMREDFFKLCNGINAKLDRFSSKDVLNSFEAFGVDMENILVDCGVQIGPTKFEKLNTMHQRIVDVIPTDEESKNGMVAERISDAYLYQGRVLLKERVKIYRYTGEGKTEGDGKNEQ